MLDMAKHQYDEVRGIYVKLDHVMSAGPTGAILYMIRRRELLHV